MPCVESKQIYNFPTNTFKINGSVKFQINSQKSPEQVHIWRRSFDIPPPDGESLKDTADRVLPYFETEIMPKVISGSSILIAAHGNSIRALCKYLFKLDENQISLLEIPTGNPLLINFDENQNIVTCKYLDKKRAKDLLVF